MSRRLPRAPRGDSGQAALEHIGALAVVFAVIVLVIAAFAANAPLVGDRTAVLICRVLTVGQGGCGGSSPSGEARQPTAPCVLRADGDDMNATISITFVEVGGDRSFMVEERSDGTFRITQSTGSDVAATAGVGASTSFTVADNSVGLGASADVSGGVTFQGGQEWIAESREEADRLTSAENWDRFDDLVAGSNPALGALPWVRDKLGIGEVLPAPDRVYVAGGLTAGASAYAGAGPAVAEASAEATALLGYSQAPGSEERTFYFESTVEADGSAGVALGVDTLGAELTGEVTVLTSVTVDADGRLTTVSRSALATGSSAGLTNVLFGGDVDALTSGQVGTGSQWDATLPIRSDDDRLAAASLLASTGINPLGIGVQDDPDGLRPDPLGASFMDAVRDRGELTRYDIDADESTWLEGSGEVALGAKIGLGGGYSTNTMTASDHVYWDGNGFAARTNC